ncbi:hypothetical protein OHC33_004805 [Knufia fluminis]|uniref:NF-X1-type domain-containing protein n=1 Tax=Knufia fluminis TaxID=191047 RepID=A0AAN8INJ2_9EURO|nr:hypothetical protein OHC33_004805 [Knufia fluminis]
MTATKGGVFPCQTNTLRDEPRPKTSYFDVNGPGEKSRLGPRHDNDHVFIPDISILPTIDECLSITRPPWMPKRNVDFNHFMEHGYSRHIDTQFRLLRHDSVEKIRDINYKAAQEAFLLNAGAKEFYREDYVESASGHRFFLYHNLRVEAIVPDEYEGLTIQLSFDCPKFLRGRQMYKSTRFDRGMLCSVLQLDHDTNELHIHYFNIQRRLSTYSLDSRNGRGRRAAVELSMPPHISKQDQKDILPIATGTRPNCTMALIEYPKLLYAGFGNALHCLQNMSDFAYAFGQYISPRQEAYQYNQEQELRVHPPSYARDPDFLFDLQPLTGRSESQIGLGDFEDDKFAATLQHLADYTTLDAGQAVALLSSLNREFAFTQGPPGCGKTFLSVALARVLLASRPSDRKLPILLVCHTNHALDAFMTGLRDAGVENLLRVGSSSKEEWTRVVNLKSLSKEERYTNGERTGRHRASVQKDSNYAHLEAWCKGLTGEVLTGYPCWQHVAYIVEEEYPQVYSQLVTAASEPQIQAFTYDYWARGGDLNTIESLQNELSQRLAVNDDVKDDAGKAECKAKYLLTNIASFTKTQTMAAGEHDVWRLPLQRRQALVREWQNKIGKEKITARLCEIQDAHKRHSESVRLIKDQKEIRIMRKKNVVGITTTACAGRWEMLRQVGFEILICEEAGEVLEAHALCCLLPSLKHAINVGDPLQLRPDVEEQTMTLETSRGRDYRLDESLFERIMQPIDNLAKTIPTTQLNVQRRMHPDIADISRITYPFLQDHSTTWSNPVPKGLDHRMWWLHHDIAEDEATGVSQSITNMHEVRIVKELVTYLLRGSDYSPGDIAVLTPYAGQVAELRTVLSEQCTVWVSEKDKDILVDNGAIEPDSVELDEHKQLRVSMQSMLRLSTIDNFQGEEAKIILLSTVRSGSKLGFVRTPNRINVMCSRAKHGFYIIGNAQALEADEIWRSIIDIFAIKGVIANDIRLRCDRHPEHYILASSAEDFEKFPTCEISCDQKLECGHTCTESCHDPSLHELIPCKSPCERRLRCGHRCRKLCGEQCGSCQKVRRRYQRSCGHHALESCSGEPIPCDHFGGYLTLSCGRHAVGYTCGEGAKSFECDAVCGQELSCGHACEGKCGLCDITQDHAVCESACGKVMACGHKCTAFCHGQSGCPPCKQLCQSSCSHATTTRQCNEAPVPCLQDVSAVGPYGWAQTTICCLTTGQVPSGSSLLGPKQIDAVSPAITVLLNATIEELARKADVRIEMLDRTSYLMILKFQEKAQNAKSMAMAARSVIEECLSHGDDIIELEKEVAVLASVLEKLEVGTQAVETAYSCRLPTVPRTARSKLDGIRIRAILARARDATSMASFSMKSRDDSQQMQRAALELFSYAENLLESILKGFSHNEDLTESVTMVKCRLLLEEINSMVTE